MKLVLRITHSICVLTVLVAVFVLSSGRSHAQDIGTAPVCSGNWHNLIGWNSIPPVGGSENYNGNGNTVSVAATANGSPSLLVTYSPGYGPPYGGDPILETALVDLAFTFGVPVSLMRILHTDYDSNEGGVLTTPGANVSVTNVGTNVIRTDQPSAGQARWERNGSTAGAGDLDDAAIIGIKSSVSSFTLSSTTRQIVPVSGNGSQGLTNLQACLDFTDAPPSYGNTYHALLETPTVFLGTTAPTGDTNPYNSATASGDADNGVTLPASAVAGMPFDVTVVSTGGGLVQGWIDWNQNGNFLDAGEQIITDGSGGTISVTVPSNAVAGTTFARFRTATASVSPIAAAADGEVEDYQFTVTAGNPALTLDKVADDDTLRAVGDVITYTYTVTNSGNVDINNVTVADAHNGSGPAPTPTGEVLLNDAAPLGDSTDGAPNGSWDVLGVGDSVTFTGTYTVTQNDVDSKQ